MLTVEQALEGLQITVSNYGRGHVYEPVRFKDSTLAACFYSDGGGLPGCIVGHVLYLYAPEEFDRLAEREKWVDGAPTQASVSISLCNASIPHDVRHVLQAAQTIQDAGGPWGSALTNATIAAQNAGYTATKTGDNANDSV